MIPRCWIFGLIFGTIFELQHSAMSKSLTVVCANWHCFAKFSWIRPGLGINIQHTSRPPPQSPRIICGNIPFLDTRILAIGLPKIYYIICSSADWYTYSILWMYNLNNPSTSSSSSKYINGGELWDVAINEMETYQLDNHQPLILRQLQSQSWACQAFL